MPGWAKQCFVRTRRLTRAALAALALMLGIAAIDTSSLAAAVSPPKIEGVWSFNGGQIAVVHTEEGTFEGKVVAETKFAECAHPVGQRIWSQMRLQGNGSYTGLHQWYFESASCTLNPTLGPTAWRVIQAEGGTHYLRACFSSPGGPQPTIALDGSSSGVTYGCVNSALIAPLPTSSVLSLKRLATLPPNRFCLSRRSFEIHVRDPIHDPFKSITITLAGHALKVTRTGQFSVATVDLRGLPRGAFTISVRATTVLGHVLAGHRTFHTCAKKRLRSVKHGHHKPGR
jgi:hypothetical protein